ncbi:hypothetical protein DFQ02_105207 [Seonamhaeicola aphaedonensis]|uniref:Uncharacterized protein n=1 Tax=Seonamhaeicola aphaedonensis TaxID=1461338 RepID=A0A3D9HER8_9FLAO|nr:hypothetical protein DFQ02_105207 [Seonamhaeicola aphaedonensis]
MLVYFEYKKEATITSLPLSYSDKVRVYFGID